MERAATRKRSRPPSAPGAKAARCAAISSPTSSSPSPTAMRSMKGATGSGIREGAHAAHEDHGVPGPAVDGPRRNARQPQHPHQVDVVTLVGHRESDQVEVGEGPERLQREGRGLRAELLVEVLRIRKEDALADDVGNRVEVAVDGLETQVGHAHRVRIGVHEGHRGPPSPVLADCSLLAGKELLRFSLQGPGHGLRVSPSPSRPGTRMPGHASGEMRQRYGEKTFEEAASDLTETATGSAAPGSDPHDLNVDGAGPRAVQLREEDGLEPAQRELAAGDPHRHAPPEQGRAEMRGGVAALAVRVAGIIVSVGPGPRVRAGRPSP